MPSALPDGDPAPLDGSLPPGIADRVGRRPFGVYVHVPFCLTRCGYCDFNTYTAGELGAEVSTTTYVNSAIAELRLARRVLGPGELPVRSVFFGGGTPTLLPPRDLGAILRAVDGEFGLTSDAEVTTEANPESVDPGSLAALRSVGFSRLSLGMQSSRPHVLRALDRQHTAGRAVAAVGWARAAGFGSVSLDLIYGTPGESADDWLASVEAALAAGPQHVSAYALVVEPGTRLARRVARGELPAPDDDDLAEKYAAADDRFHAAGLDWYEISNWARAGHACRHNLGYWAGDDWWGIGPGAHSHVGGVRWWNVKHPAGYAARLAAGRSPAQAREQLSAGQRRDEAVLLGVRLADGLALSALSAAGQQGAAGAVRDGLLESTAHTAGRAVLTRSGRLLCDTVVRALLPD